ncbi:hypothetical protein [Sulfuricurvum sp.]|uniref:hypothetical protein n=1 Tax=Sulfuricurvum sp. TaxID=2025608 RepID=UPI002607A145|nr:hypothetical protein [Sulfuricurvum sp.]MDD2267012.1 hypothetical protein [Sulfuricurvum sp.]MDD2782628.1 hypothetical protein [Sulfuricurvum sp.]
MKKAWIENGKIRDIANGDPVDLFHPDIAINYNTDVPDSAVVGAELIDGVWVNPVIDAVIDTVVVNKVPLLSPIEFKMLFSSEERIAIKTSTDAVVQDFFELINDLRLTYVDRNLQSVKDALAYLEHINLIASGRAMEILS